MAVAVEVQEQPDRPVVIALRGDLDIYTVRPFLAQLRHDPSEVDLVFDLTAVELVDSSGLRALVSLCRHAARHGHSISLICSRQLRRLFVIAGLEQELMLRTMGGGATGGPQQVIVLSEVRSGLHSLPATAPSVGAVG